MLDSTSRGYVDLGNSDISFRQNNDICFFTCLAYVSLSICNVGLLIVPVSAPGLCIPDVQCHVRYSLGSESTGNVNVYSRVICPVTRRRTVRALKIK